MGGSCRNQADAGRYAAVLVSAAIQRCFLYGQIESGESASVVWRPYCIPVRAQHVLLHRRETGLKARGSVRVRASKSGAIDCQPSVMVWLPSRMQGVIES